MTETAERVREALRWLERRGTKRVRDDMLTRYGVTAPKAYGVSVGAIQQLAKRLGRDHELAAALWATGWYEARLLSVVRRRAGARHARADGPLGARLRQLGRLRHGVLLPVRPDAARLAQGRAVERAPRRVRAGAPPSRCSRAWRCTTSRRRDAPFLARLPLIERAAADERNFVKKGVSWALRAVGRRSVALNDAAVHLARRLAESPDAPARWVGKDALRELTSPKLRKSLATRRRVSAAPKAPARSASRSP